MLSINVLIVILLSFSDGFLKDPDELIVELVKPIGRIRGHILRTSLGKEFYAFQDVPYAAPPIGNRRFEAPQPHDGWKHTLDVSENRKMCIQFHLFSNEQSSEDETEDCLVLNVYTSVKPGSKSSLPILLWTFGGGFFEGSNNIEHFHPNYFIDEDIIVVIANYRLGPLGFLSTGDDVITGNMGLKDQQCALAWTVENIHLFGGDARKIVIAGHSAGAFALGFQILSKRNTGLFRGAIQHSGSPLVSGGFQTNPKQYAVQLIQKLDNTEEFDPENNTRHVEILRKATVDEIRRATKTVEDKEFQNGYMPSMIWLPVMENNRSVDAIVTTSMRQDFSDGNFNKIPILMGVTSEESIYYLPIIPASNFDESARRFDNDSSLLIHPRLNIKDKVTKIAGSLLKALYTSSTFLEDKYAFIRFTSDAYFTRAAIEQANLMARHVLVYFYQFCLGVSPNSSFPGAPHTAELPYIWYNKKVESSLREVDRSRVFRMWTNFIKYLNPTPEEDSLLQNIRWTKLDPATMNYLNINKTLSMEINPRNYKGIRNILNDYVQQPFNVY